MTTPLTNPTLKTDAAQSLRTELQRHPERERPEAVPEILTAAYLVHVGYAEGEQPYVIPMAYHYDPADPDWLYLHGSSKSHTLQALAGGQRVCLTVTEAQGLVYSRDAMHHSMNYRSVVAFGRGESITDPDRKARLMDDMIRRYHPGRQGGRDYTLAPESHIDATLVVGIQLEHSSAKVRTGGATGPQDSDLWATGQSGVVPLQARQDHWRPLLWERRPYWVRCGLRAEVPHDAERVLALLQHTYWNPDITLERVQRRLDHSIAFGLYHEQELVGFARLVSDQDAFAYLADVVIDPAHRGLGLGKWLIQCVHAHPLMDRIRWCLLSTRDMQPFYSQMGYQAHPKPEKLMVHIPANGNQEVLR
jgi:uncharacterized protein